jgi:hypothetical protein
MNSKYLKSLRDGHPFIVHIVNKIFIILRFVSKRVLDFAKKHYRKSI